MEDTLARTRCSICGGGLAFEEWSRGTESCGRCRRGGSGGAPAAVFVRGPGTAAPPPSRPGVQPRPPVRRSAQGGTLSEEYQRLLDEVPDGLIDEIVAALETEAQRMEAEEPGATSPVREVLNELGIGRSPFELQAAAWGFAVGFAANVALAKYAQIQSGAPMSQFVVPLLVGGLAAGAACAAIGWGLAKLRER